MTRVGISLLTLVPGISGGSETYARALTRTLAAEGTLDYHVFLPTIAPDATKTAAGPLVASSTAATTGPPSVPSESSMPLTALAPVRS